VTALASTVPVGFHAQVGGVRFGRIDTVFVVAGLLVIAPGCMPPWLCERSSNRSR